jgi:hypothetical protein
MANMTSISASSPYYAMTRIYRLFGYETTFDEKVCARWWKEKLGSHS